MRHELIGNGAVDDAVIESERQHARHPRDDSVADDGRPLFNRADAENRHLRLVDDGRAEQRADISRVRHRKGPAAHLIGFQLLRARARREIGNRGGDRGHVQSVDVPDDRNDQPALERHGNPDVDRLVIDDAVGVDRRIEDRERLQRIGRGFDDEREVADLPGLANVRDSREVDFEDGVHVRRSAPARHHVLGDRLTHDRHLLDAIARTVRPVLLFPPALPFLAAASHEREDIVFCDAAADAGAVDLRQIDVVFLRELADQRRRAIARDVFGRRRRRIDGCLRGLRRLRRRRGFRGRGTWRCRFSAAANHCNDAVDRNRVAFLRENLGENAGRRRGNLRIDFVGRDFKQRLVAIHLVADLLDPADDRALGNGFAHLRHQYIHGSVMSVLRRHAPRAPLRRSPRPSSDARERCE